MTNMADPATATAAATQSKPATPAAPKADAKRFSDAQITEIRSLRAQKNEAGTGPEWSHAKLAAKFGTTAGVISQIVRNRTYKDANYKPVNDGK
jgi:hypothetical protein